MGYRSEPKTRSDLNKFFDIEDEFSSDESELGIAEEIRLSQFISSFYLDYPLLGEIITKLTLQPTNSSKIPTYGCNSRVLYFNPKFTVNKERAEIKGFFAHSAIHLILDHYHRIEDENVFMYKVSSEISTLQIFLELKNNLFEDNRVLHPNLLGPWFSTEADELLESLQIIDQKEIYEKIDKIWRETNYSDYVNIYKPTSFRDDLNDKEKKRILQIVGLKRMCQYWEVTEFLQNNLHKNDIIEDHRIKSIIKQVIQKHGLGIDFPYAIKNMIEEDYIQHSPWYRLLEQYLQENMVLDWLWLPPNRKYINDELYLPSTKKKNFRVILAMKIGEITDEMANEITTETIQILSSIFSFELRIIGFHNSIEFDIIVDETYFFYEDLEISMTRKIFGQNEPYSNLFGHIENLPDEPDLLIIFTKASTDPRSEGPDYQVLWITQFPVNHFYGDSILFKNDTQIKSWDYKRNIVKSKLDKQQSKRNTPKTEIDKVSDDSEQVNYSVDTLIPLFLSIITAMILLTMLLVFLL